MTALGLLIADTSGNAGTPSTGGTFNFSNAPTALNGTNPGATGDPFASFLLGIPTGGTYQSSGWTYARTKYHAYFLDDSWRVSNKLTLNLGVRWEIPGVYTEDEDRIVTFNPAAINPVLQGQTNPVTGQPYLGAFELVNSTEQAVRTNIETQQIAELPLKSRDFLDLTLLAPGVVTDQGSAAGGGT